MTIDSTVNREEMTGTATSMHIPFVYYNKDHVRVVHVSADGTENDWERGTEFDLSGDGSIKSGQLDIVTAPTDHTLKPQEKLVILLYPALKQEVDLPSGNFTADIEQGLDIGTQVALRQQQEIDRSLKFSEGSVFENKTFPDPVADHAIVWNAGESLENRSISDLTGFTNYYLGPFDSDPATRNDGSTLQSGDLYFNRTNKALNVYDGSTWRQSIAASSLITFTFTAVGGETSISDADDDSKTLSYPIGNIRVFLNGVLLDNADYSATTGSSITDLTPLVANDIVHIETWPDIATLGTIAGQDAGAVNIGGGTIDNTNIGVTTPAVATFSTLTLNGAPIITDNNTCVDFRDGDTTSIVSQSDATKKLRFNVSGISTGQSRTMTVPNTDFNVPGLTSSEATQLENIDGTTISSTQWGYLGALNQDVAYTSNVTFNDLQTNGTTNLGSVFTDKVRVGGATGTAVNENMTLPDSIALNNGSIQSFWAVTGGVIAIGSLSNDVVDVRVNNTQVARFNTSGNAVFNGTIDAVGLNTTDTNVFTAPANALAVRMRGRSSDDISLMEFWNNATTTNFASILGSNSELRFTSSTGVQTWFTGGSEGMRLDTNHNFTVGTTLGVASGRGIHYHNPIVGQETRLSLTTNGTGDTTGAGLQIAVTDSGEATIEQRSAQPLKLATNNIVRATWDASGNATFEEDVSVGERLFIVGSGTYAPTITIEAHGAGDDYGFQTSGDGLRIRNMTDGRDEMWFIGDGKLAFLGSSSLAGADVSIHAPNLAIKHSGAGGPLLVSQYDSLGNASINNQNLGTLYLATNNTFRWGIGSAGPLFPAADNAYALGTDQFRVSQGHFAQDVYVGQSYTAANYHTQLGDRWLSHYLSGDTASQLGGERFFNNSGELVANHWTTGDSSAGIWRFQLNGAGHFDFNNNSTSITANTPSFRINGLASSVNYWEVDPSTTGNAPRLKVGGSDSNPNAIIQTKGTGHLFVLNGTSTVGRIYGAASAANYISLVGTVSGNAASIDASGSDTNIDISINPQGSGVVRYGTHTAIGSETVTGYITIKDASGTTRKLAVVS